MEILEINENKEQYIDLLLIDGQESTIEKNINNGVLFALYEDFDLKTAAVITKENNDNYEIKNLATLEIYQGKGYGAGMIKHIIKYCEKKCKKIIVGIGDNEKTQIFYERLGFTYFNTINEKIYMKYEYK